MSLRNMRKFLGDTNKLPPLEGNSDEEFEPLYAKETKSKFTYAGLELSSHSASDQEVPEEEDEIVEPEQKTKKKKKKKKKQRQPKIPAVANGDELDEIDKSVLEVNAILGAPAASAAPLEKEVNHRKLLLSVQAKHLDFNNELKRIFGSENIDDDARGKKYRPHNVVKYRRAAIVPIPENKHFHSVGLSMALLRRENGCSYFTFNHNRDYQKMHQHFLDMVGNGDVTPAEESPRTTHIEGLLERADFMFRAEEFTAANKILESIISYYHYIAHPCFNLTDQSVRLEYKYMENRPFFIAVLKYCHMLTNKACHRTALELAKLLLNLDPSDPLAIIYVIDVIALRAREHQWLIDTIDYWKKERDAEYLFNMQYSYALAHYHVAKKSKSNDFSRADQLLQDAMLLYPTYASRIFENCKHDPSMHIRNHPYFDVAAEAKFPEKIKIATIFHAKLVCWRWREPPVMKWFFRNGNELVEKLNNDPDTKKRSEEMALKRLHLLAGCPNEIHRHLLVVRNMANLLVEWELLQMSRERAWDPLPPVHGVNRYSYGFASELDPRYYTGLFNIFSMYVSPDVCRKSYRAWLRTFRNSSSSSCQSDSEDEIDNRAAARLQAMAHLHTMALQRMLMHSRLCQCRHSQHGFGRPHQEYSTSDDSNDHSDELSEPEIDVPTP